MGRLNRAVVAAMAAAVLAAGCSRPERPAVVPAGGKVLLQQADGKVTPMAGAHVVLIPINADTRLPAYPSARAGPDGSFRLGTFGADDGAPAGDYVVTVEWHDRSRPKYDVAGRGETDRGPDKLKGAYADRTKSPLRATVAAGRELTIIVPAP